MFGPLTARTSPSSRDRCCPRRSGETDRYGSSGSPTSSTTGASVSWARRITAWSTGSPPSSSAKCCSIRSPTRLRSRGTSGSPRRRPVRRDGWWTGWSTGRATSWHWPGRPRGSHCHRRRWPAVCIEPAGRCSAHSRRPLPWTSLNGPISPYRALATLARPLDELRAIKRAYGCTVNDVVLAASSGGVRRHLERHGETPARLKAMVPVNVRASGAAGELGNRISFIFLELPCDEPSPERGFGTSAMRRSGPRRPESRRGQRPCSTSPPPRRPRCNGRCRAWWPAPARSTWWSRTSPGRRTRCGCSGAACVRPTPSCRWPIATRSRSASRPLRTAPSSGSTRTATPARRGAAQRRHRRRTG